MIATDPRLTESVPPEQELCKALAKWLRGNGWEANEEPTVYLPGSRTPLYPDFIITRNDVIGPVHAKAGRDKQGRWFGCTHGVLQQAQEMRPVSMITYIAVNEPHPNYRSQHEMIAQMAHGEGIGLLMRLRDLQVRHIYEASVNVKANVKPLMQAISGHRDVLAAGTAGGHRFRKSDRQWDWVHDLVRRHDDPSGMTQQDVRIAMPELVAEEVRQAFKTAEKGRIAGVRVSKIGGPRRLVLIGGSA